MKYSYNRKKVIAYIFACSIIISSALTFTNGILQNEHNLSLDKKDPTQVELASNKKELNSNKERNKRTESKSAAELSYNFVYFLISKAVEITTISRPK